MQFFANRRYGKEVQGWFRFFAGVGQGRAGQTARRARYGDCSMITKHSLMRAECAR